MKNVKYLIFLLFSIFIFNPSVYSLTNYDTQYNISIPNYDEYYSNVTCGSESIKDLLHNFIDNYNDSSSLYHIIIFPDFINSSYYYSQDKLTFFAYKKSKTQYNRFSFYGLSSGNIEIDYAWNVTGNDTVSYSYIVDLDTCDTSISSSSSFQSFLSYISGNLTINSSNYTTYADSNGHFIRSMDPGSPSADYKRFIKSSANTGFSSFNNTDNFTINDAPWFYWSSRTMSYKAVYTTSDFIQSSNKFYKKLHIVQNDTTYNYESNLVSFWDIKDNYITIEPLIVGSDSTLKTIYTNIPSSDFNNFKLTIELDKNNSNITGYDYSHNISNPEMCFGRVNHNNNYFTYVPLSCTWEIDTNYVNNHVKIEYSNLQFFNNGVEVLDMSSYDKLFITFPNNINNEDIDMSASNISIYTNMGNFIYNEYLGSIYDNFDDLPPLFKFYLSSNSSSIYDVYSRVYFSDIFTTSYTFWNQFNPTTLQPTSIVGNIYKYFTKLSVSNTISSSIMIFQNEYNTSVNRIDFIFHSNLVISYNPLSDSFYYIDSQDTIQNSNISVPYDINPSNTYDISYYINKINSFIDDLSVDISELSVIIQTLYDGLPLIIRSFIFVSFLIFNIYVLYILIRRE